MKELEWSCRETVPLIFVYYHSEKEGALVKHSACYESQNCPLEEYGAEPAVMIDEKTLYHIPPFRYMIY